MSDAEADEGEGERSFPVLYLFLPSIPDPLPFPSSIPDPLPLSNPSLPFPSLRIALVLVYWVGGKLIPVAVYD